MDRKVIWAESAWNDLDKIADYISQDSPRYAAAFAREMVEAASTLASFAQRGRIVPEFDRPTIRELLVRNYRLIYSTASAEVCVLGIVHGARDLGALWDREQRSTK